MKCAFLRSCLAVPYPGAVLIASEMCARVCSRDTSYPSSQASEWGMESEQHAGRGLSAPRYLVRGKNPSRLEAWAWALPRTDQTLKNTDVSQHYLRASVCWGLQQFVVCPTWRCRRWTGRGGVLGDFMWRGLGRRRPAGRLGRSSKQVSEEVSGCRCRRRRLG